VECSTGTTLQADLFLHLLNHQLTDYFSPICRNHCSSDELKWMGDLKKICKEESTVTIVVPQWPSQAWYQALIKWLVDLSLHLPKCMDLLQILSNHAHPLISWLITASRLQNVIQKTLPLAGQGGVKERVQPREIGVISIVNSRLILFHVL